MKKGFTLIEIVIYIGILGIIVSIVASILLWVVNSNVKVKAMRDVLANGRRAIAIMSHEIKEAKGIYFPTTTSTQISLETSEHVPQGENMSYLDFFLCGQGNATNTLCVKKESVSPYALTSETVEIRNLMFSLVYSSTTPSLGITLEIRYKNPNNRSERQASVILNSTVLSRGY